MRNKEKAYIAGFFDGDGSIMAHIEPHSELKLGCRIRVVMKFSQHEKEEKILQWIHSTIQT